MPRARLTDTAKTKYHSSNGLLHLHAWFPEMKIPSKTDANETIQLIKCNLITTFFFAGGCLGWFRAERLSVSWTKVSRTLWSYAPVWLYVNLWQKHARRPSIQTTTIYTRWQQPDNCKKTINSAAFYLNLIPSLSLSLSRRCSKLELHMSRSVASIVKTTHERCGPFSLVVLSQRRGRVTTLSGYPAKTLSETLSSKLQLNTFKSPKD